MTFECEDCGETFESKGKYSAHRRWEHTEPKKKEERPETQVETNREIDSRHYKGHHTKIEVEDYQKSKYQCQKCSAPVPAGMNCQECGEELNWYPKGVY